jgi:hypothetical protein
MKVGVRLRQFATKPVTFFLDPVERLLGLSEFSTDWFQDLPSGYLPTPEKVFLENDEGPRFRLPGQCRTPQVTFLQCCLKV